MPIRFMPSGYYYSDFLIIAVIASAIIALIATIVICIAVLPTRRREKMGGFGKFLHGVFNFHSLLIEKILKFCYIFATFYVIVYGLINIFNFNDSTYVGWVGIIIMILGPIVIRIFYEFLMMFILLVRNVIEIRNKLYSADSKKKLERAMGCTPEDIQSEAPSPKIEKPADDKKPADLGFCIYCGAQYNKSEGGCTNPDCPSNKH